MGLRTLTDGGVHNEGHASVCIIGAGVAGLLIACNLARRGIRVIVLESGKASFDTSIHDLSALHEPPQNYTRAMTGHYRALGGSSTQWGGRMIPISSHERDERPYLDLPAWPLTSSVLDRYRQEVEQLMGIDEGSFEETALENLDPGLAFPRNQEDFTCRWAKWPPFWRCNLANLLKKQINNLKDLQIVLEATVCDFDVDREKGQLRSVIARSLNGRSLKVAAHHFILAAGTIETTRLMLWMDRRSSERAFESTSVLGRYFQDHIDVDVGRISRRELGVTNRLFGYHFRGTTRRSLHLELSKASQRAEEVGSAFAYMHMDLSDSGLEKVKKVARGLQRGRIEATAPEVFSLAREIGLIGRSAYWRYARRQLFIPKDVRMHMHVCLEQMPDWSNRITLGPENDPLGLPRAHLKWEPRAADERTFRATVRRLSNYWQSSGFERVCPIEWAQADPGGNFFSRVNDYAHPSGTIRMGADPSRSIVGADLRCHHVPNLSVVGAAVFPSAGSANPTMTIMQLALHCANFFQSSTFKSF